MKHESLTEKWVREFRERNASFVPPQARWEELNKLIQRVEAGQKSIAELLPIARARARVCASRAAW